jgi:hypothetical protein
VNGRQLLWLILIGGVAFWLWKHGTVTKGVEQAPARPGASPATVGAPRSAGQECLASAEAADRATQDAASVLLRPPLDPPAFAAASERASSAISSAEAKCGGDGSASERKAMEEANSALSEMRGLLSDLSGALSGIGSASDAPRRREAIDTRLAAARAALLD